MTTSCERLAQHRNDSDATATYAMVRLTNESRSGRFSQIYQCEATPWAPPAWPDRADICASWPRPLEAMGMPARRLRGPG